MVKECEWHCSVMKEWDHRLLSGNRVPHLIIMSALPDNNTTVFKCHRVFLILKIVVSTYHKFVPVNI